MGKTNKDRELKGYPRVPEWARAKPTKIHRNSKDKRKQQKLDDDFIDCREEYYEYEMD